MMYVAVEQMDSITKVSYVFSNANKGDQQYCCLNCYLNVSAYWDVVFVSHEVFVPSENERR